MASTYVLRRGGGAGGGGVFGRAPAFAAGLGLEPFCAVLTGFFAAAATRAFFTGGFVAALALGLDDGFAFTGAAFAFGLDGDDFFGGAVLRRSFAMAAPVAANAATDDDDRKRFGGVTLTDAPKWGQERRARSMAA